MNTQPGAEQTSVNNTQPAAPQQTFNAIPEVNTAAPTSNNSSLIIPELNIGGQSKQDNASNVNVPNVLKKEPNPKELIEVPSILRNKN